MLRACVSAWDGTRNKFGLSFNEHGRPGAGVPGLIGVLGSTAHACEQPHKARALRELSLLNAVAEGPGSEEQGLLKSTSCADW